MGNIYLGTNPVGKIYLGSTLILDNTGGGSAPLDWSVLPNVPVSKRSGIETAINTLPYKGQFTLDSLATSHAWWDFRHFDTMFSDSGFTTPITAIGQTVGGVKSWTDGANNLIQPTSSKRAQTTTLGLLFDGVDDFLLSSGLTISDLANVHVTSFMRPRRDLQTRGGTMLALGETVTNASVLGTGTTEIGQDPAPNLAGLRHTIGWMVLNVPVADSWAIASLQHRNQLFWGRSGDLQKPGQSFTPPSSLVGIGAWGSGGAFPLCCEVAAVIVGPSLSQTAINAIADFMAAYYI